jgi:hypothetical protein
MGALHEQRVDAFGGLLQQFFEQARLSSMAPKVPRVEQSLAARLHQERVCVERAVVVQERRDGERSDLDGAAVREIAGRIQGEAERAEERGLGENAGGARSDEDRGRPRGLRQQAIVIGVRMAYHHTVKARVGAVCEATDGGERDVFTRSGGEREPEIED